MMKNYELKTVHLKIGEFTFNVTQHEYLKMKLESYVKANTSYDYQEYGEPKPDYKSRLNDLLVKHCLKNFTLEELFIIFFNSEACYYLSDNMIGESKSIAIESIYESELSEKDKKRLTKKISDMPKVMFGLLHEFIHLSDLFYDNENECVIYPDISDVEIKYIMI